MKNKKTIELPRRMDAVLEGEIRKMASPNLYTYLLTIKKSILSMNPIIRKIGTFEDGFVRFNLTSSETNVSCGLYRYSVVAYRQGKRYELDNGYIEFTQWCVNDDSDTPSTSVVPTTAIPTLIPTTAIPTTLKPTTLRPTTLRPTTIVPTTLMPTTLKPTTLRPTTLAPTTLKPTTLAPTSVVPTTLKPTTLKPTTTIKPTTTTKPTTTLRPTTQKPTTQAPTSAVPTSAQPTSATPTSQKPTSVVPTSAQPTQQPTEAPTQQPTQQPTSAQPTQAPPTEEPVNYLYVRTNGNDSTGDGSLQSPFATIQRAVQFAQNGDAINVGQGTFTINSTINLPLGVSVRGQGQEQTYIQGSASPLFALDSSITANGNQKISYLTFDGRNSTTSAVSVSARNNVTFEYVNAHDFTHHAIMALGQAHNVPMENLKFRYCDFENNSGMDGGHYTGALILSGIKNLTMSNVFSTETKQNQGWPLKMWWLGDPNDPSGDTNNGGYIYGADIHDCSFVKTRNDGYWEICIEGRYLYGFHFYNNEVMGNLDLNDAYSYDGLYVSQSNRYQYGAWVHNNVFHFTNDYASAGNSDCIGMTLEFGQRDTIIERNRFEGVGGICDMYIRQGRTAENVTIRYNLGYNLKTGKGDAIFSQGNNGNIRDMMIYNNTIIGSTSSMPTRGVYIDRGGEASPMTSINGLYVFNNLIKNVSYYPMQFANCSNYTNLFVRNNYFDSCGQDNAQFASGISYDYSNNNHGNAMLSGYTPQSGSPLLDAGTMAIGTWNNIKDLDGRNVPFNNSVDIGCIEVGGTTDAPSVTTTALPQPTSSAPTSQPPTSATPTTGAPTTTIDPTQIYENRLLYSRDLDNPAWNDVASGDSAPNVVADQAVDTTGARTMDLITTHHDYNNKLSQKQVPVSEGTYYLKYDGILGTSNDVRYIIWDEQHYQVLATGNMAQNLTSSVSRQTISFNVPSGCTSVEVEICVYNEALEVEGVDGTIYLGRMQLASNDNYRYITTFGERVIAEVVTTTTAQPTSQPTSTAQPTSAPTTTLAPTAEPTTTLAPTSAPTSQVPTTLPPSQPLNDKVIFLHHSTGGQLLADNYGGLGKDLNDAGYFLSDICFEWDAPQNANIGDYMDIGNWFTWFADETIQGNGKARRDNIMEAVYTEYDRDSYNSANFGSYTRNIAQPQGENSIIIFKSCWSSGDIANSGSSSIRGLDHYQATYTIANCKDIYNAILPYFKAHADKMFIVFTTPPRPIEEGNTNSTYADNLRTLDMWMLEDWLTENNWKDKNVYVFDYHNILTGVNNHHRVVNGVEEHTIASGSGNYLIPSYHSSGDEHPNATAQQKVADEFMSLLPYWKAKYYAWIQLTTTTPQPTTGVPIVTTQAPVTTTAKPQTTTAQPQSGGVLGTDKLGSFILG